MRGFLAGTLLLIAAEVFLTNKGADAAGGLIGWSADLFERVLSSDVAAIPQVATKATTGSTSSTTSSSTVPGGSTGVSGIITGV